MATTRHLYAVKEVFLTLQGEGINAGRVAVFCRFSGCNLWSGREIDRDRAVCRFCDTDFVGTDGEHGGRYEADALAALMAGLWPQGVGPHSGGPRRNGRRLAVLTGGEPLLQVDAALVASLHAHGFEIAIETNGTISPPAGIDWICVSPKASSPLQITAGDELKLVYPQDDAPPARFEALDFRHFLLQPKDGPDRDAAIAATISYCLAHPGWRMSVQTHKAVGIR